VKFWQIMFGLTGVGQVCVGVLLMVLMIWSFMSPVTLLQHLLPDTVQVSVLAANSWQQTAVGFGMHAFADIYNGLEQVLYAKSSVHRVSLSPTVSVWNTTRFIISFLWSVKLIEGLVFFYDLKPGNLISILQWKPLALLLVASLLVDSLVFRPLSVLAQRRFLDQLPPKANVQTKEQNALNWIQQYCRGVFYYESILSGTSGMVYMLTPQIYLWLYDFPNKDDFLALWSLSQFGILVTAFGLYQMSAEIDTRSALVAWWLFLDFVWLYIYVEGVRAVFDPLFNPLTFQGGNFWQHSAFHADSTLAFARTVFLLMVLVRGRGKPKLD
jgi:hypothetical protein